MMSTATLLAAPVKRLMGFTTLLSGPTSEEDKLQELPLLRPQNANVSDEHHRGKQRCISPGSVVLLCRRYIFLLVNIAAWYTTNGMNGISMQSFASSIPEHSVLTKYSVTFLVTALQLLLGALLGRVMLSLYCRFISDQQQQTTHHPSSRINWWSFTTTQTILAALHAAGSVCTNLGFMNGKASLVQVIKLLEPFETLFFTKLLIKEEGDSFNAGVISSMCLTLGAAISLLPNKANSSDTYHTAIFFASLSGLTLSLRNVLQRRQHGAVQADVAQIKDKLEKSLVLFTQISLHSGRLLLVVSAPLMLMLLHQQANGGESTAVGEILWNGLDVGLLSWHPLYNAFSMITLGFCSAVTHSLLNAGKRVYAILMAIVWFKEGFTEQTAMGLLLVTVGGVWYTVEMKEGQVKGKPTAAVEPSSVPWWVKPLVAIVLLQNDWSSLFSR
jgi:uncharacterized membrane protein